MWSGTLEGVMMAADQIHSCLLSMIAKSVCSGTAHGICLTAWLAAHKLSAGICLGQCPML